MLHNAGQKNCIQYQKGRHFFKMMGNMPFAILKNNPSNGKRTLTPYGITTLIARFMGPTWGPSGADRTQVGPCCPHELRYLGRPQWVHWHVAQQFIVPAVLNHDIAGHRFTICSQESTIPLQMQYNTVSHNSQEWLMISSEQKLGLRKPDD